MDSWNNSLNSIIICVELMDNIIISFKLVNIKDVNSLILIKDNMEEKIL